VQSEFKNMAKLSIMHFELVISIKVLSLKGMLLVRIRPTPNNPHPVFLQRNVKA